MENLETVKFNDTLYVRADAVQETTVNFTGEESVASRMIGKNVIVRSRNEGINAGTVVLADDTGIELKDCRRLWQHYPKNTKLSWYEGVAVSGLGSSSRVSGTVPQKIIIEDYSMTACTDDAFKSIMETEPNGQS